MVNEARVRRIGDRIQQELSLVLQRKVADSRLAMVTVTAVDVDRELAYATIYITALGEEDRMNEVLRALEGARGYLRRELAARVRLRSFPQLRFRWDFSQERGARIDELLDMLKSERAGGEGETGEG
ncbi:MAG: 30S ribosome-binding factor RbfA [Anaerolineales bacterium]|nr:MAG: 30S ribosome-binding factor RbfA [Anaerolineales bacterium]